MFEKITAAPPDSILGLSEAFKSDPNPNKINLGVGVYKDAHGNTPILATAKKAEQMLLASEKGAKLIVSVGAHFNLVEFLDKGRSGMASTFLTRLRVGGKLVDAKGVSRLYRNRVSTLQVALLVASGLFALFVALGSTTAGRSMLELLGSWWNDALFWLRGLV